jgi:hypothetical protein
MGCSAVGVVNGAIVEMTCRTSFTNTLGLSGVSAFRGAVDGDANVRGSCTHSRFPGASGIFAMMRVRAAAKATAAPPAWSPAGP